MRLNYEKYLKYCKTDNDAKSKNTMISLQIKFVELRNHKIYGEIIMIYKI